MNFFGWLFSWIFGRHRHGYRGGWFRGGRGR